MKKNDDGKNVARKARGRVGVMRAIARNGKIIGIAVATVIKRNDGRKVIKRNETRIERDTKGMTRILRMTAEVMMRMIV